MKIAREIAGRGLSCGQGGGFGLKLEEDRCTGSVFGERCFAHASRPRGFICRIGPEVIFEPVGIFRFDA